MELKNMPRKDISTLISLMRYCHMPMYFKRQIRELRLDDVFLLGQLKVDDCVGQATIEKIKGKGKYRFSAIWTLTTNNTTRADVMTFGEFTLKLGGFLVFSDEDQVSVRSFARVCRYLSRLSKHVSHEDYLAMYRVNGAQRLYQGTWLTKDHVTRETVWVDQKRVHLDYGDDFLVEPFQALITKAALIGVIPNEFAENIGT